MTRRTFLLITVILLVIFGSFIAEAALKDEVCIAAQITDGVNTTVYPVECS